MSNRNNSVPSAPVASDERIRNELRKAYQRAVNIERSTTRAHLATDSGVGIHTLDSIMSQDKAKQRRIAAEDALSIAWALGERAVNALLSAIAYQGARSADEAEEDCPLDSAVTAMHQLTRFMDAAKDRRIDHVEAPGATEAVDMVIAELAPWSSAGKTA